MNDGPTDRERQDATPPSPPVSPAPLVRGARLWLAARVVQVRLRFILVLLVASLVVGMWGNLRNVYDTVWHRLHGSHGGQPAVSSDTEYWCPMCPGVVSDWPAICPVCNMDLVRRKKGEAVVLPEGLVARMQFSPYRIQLAGIRTSVVGRKPLTHEIVLAGRLRDLPAAPNAGPTDSSAAPPARKDPNLALECEAYASDLPHLTAGRTVEITVEGLPGATPIVGTIRGVAAAPGSAPVSQPPRIDIQFENPPAHLRTGMYCTARVADPLRDIEPFASMLSPSLATEAREFVAVPETAVVDTGSRRVVFVETMPGMFDGVEVTLGPRCGDDYPVLAGLEPGQKVATVGAFLIDAEARLSRNLAASYFGASRPADAEPAAGAPSGATALKPDVKPRKSKKSAAAKLSAADQELVKKQRICPVTGAELDSMGGAVAVDLPGQRVFICCKGCEAPLKKDPEKYLTKLKRK